MDPTPPEPSAVPRDPRAAFAELSRIMLSAQPLSGTLTRIAEIAKDTIPGAAEVSVTLMQEGAVSSIAFSGGLAAALDERQYDAGFGPCMDAAVSGATIAIPDTATDEVYPDFAAVARRHGVTHTLSIGLPVPQRTVGALNIYGVDPPFDEGARELATAFAGYAAVAVANAGVYASTAELARQLQRALESRAVIDQAKGILMARHGVSAEAAFNMLAERSQHANRKLRDLARELADEVTRSPDA